MIRVKNNNKNSCLMSLDNFKPKKSVIVVVAAMLMSGVATTAHATITNTAKATGTYGGVDHDSNNSSVSVPVAAPSRDLAVAIVGIPVITSSIGASTAFPDAGDTITYQYTITNNGTLTEDVSLTAPKPSFTPMGTGSAAVGTSVDPTITEITITNTTDGVAATLAPGEVTAFEVVYTLTDIDAFGSVAVTDGISLVATAKAASITGVTNFADKDATAATSTIAAVTGLSIEKKAYSGTLIGNGTLIDGTTSAKNQGDVVTYTYVVSNNGNVPLTDVSVADTHEGALIAISSMGNEAIYNSQTGHLGNTELGNSSAASDNDGTVELLAAGSEVIFKYEHTITQAEVLAQSE